VITAVRPDIVASVNVADVYSAVNRVKRMRSSKVRAVMTLHAIEAEFYEQIKSGATSLDAVIATNRLGCKLASSLGALEDHRIYYAPYGVSIPTSVQPVKKKELAPICIGFVGRLEKSQKRVDELVAIVREMDRRKISYQLLIAGAGPDEDWLRCELKSEAESGMVQFVGCLSTKEVEDLYWRLDTLLITSQWETGPIVAWEAMARGVVVVTSGYIGAGLEGNLRHGGNCLIYPLGNVEAAVECIVEAQDAELRSRLARAAIAFVRANMTQERSIEHWSQCFADINAQPIRPASPEETRLEPAGRLDRVLGTRIGEVMRHVLHGKWVPAEPGQEWPHISVKNQMPNEIFWDVARATDLRGARRVPSMVSEGSHVA